MTINQITIWCTSSDEERDMTFEISVRWHFNHAWHGKEMYLTSANLLLIALNGKSCNETSFSFIKFYLKIPFSKFWPLLWLQIVEKNLSAIFFLKHLQCCFSEKNTALDVIYNSQDLCRRRCLYLRRNTWYRIDMSQSHVNRYPGGTVSRYIAVKYVICVQNINRSCALYRYNNLPGPNFLKPDQLENELRIECPSLPCLQICPFRYANLDHVEGLACATLYRHLCSQQHIPVAPFT